MKENCSEFARLWRAYLRVRYEDVRQKGNVQAAAVARDEAALRRLRPVADAARADRLRARADLHRHVAAEAVWYAGNLWGSHTLTNFRHCKRLGR